MKAVILAGGKGTRLRPLTCNTPKPMVSLLDRPVMAYGIDLLKRYGVSDIAVTVQYLPDAIRSYFGDGADFGVRLHYVEEDQPLGTAGSVKLAEDYLRETFLVISGDALTDFRLSEAIAFHRRQQAAATLVLTRVDNPLEFGVVMTGEDGQVVRFLEKPSWGEVFSDTVNTGIYILEPHVLEYLEKGGEADFSKDLFPLLMKRGERVCGYVADGYWSDIGNLEQYRQTQFDMLNGLVEVDIHATQVLPRLWVGDRVKIGSRLALSGPAFIGSDSVVEDGAHIGEYAVIGQGCLIQSGASVENSVIWQYSLIGAGAEARGATIGRNAVVSEGVSVREGAVLGDGSRIGRKSVIQPGIRIWPGKWVESYARIHQSILQEGQRRRSLFGDGGVHGTMHEELTTLFAGKLALAYASTLPPGSRVTVGSDVSPYAGVLTSALSAGLHASGILTDELGVVTAPVSRHATYHARCVGGIHVRRIATEQGEQYVIAFWDASGLPIDKGAERKLENAFIQEDCRKVDPLETGRGTAVVDAMSRYRASLLETVDGERIRAKAFSIVIAYDYGNLKGLIPEVLDSLGCGILQLYAKAGGRELSDMVRLSRADLGIRLGSDGQLLALVDENGGEVTDEMRDVLQLLVQLDRSPEVLYVPVHVPDAVEQLGRRHGVRIVRTKTDYRSRVAACGQDGFHPCVDGLYTLVHLLRTLVDRECTLADLVGGLPRFAQTRLTVECPWQEKGRIMRSLMEETKGAPVELIDGIKLHLGGGWALIRPDTEEPCIRIVVQAPTAEEANRLAADFADKIDGYRLRTSV